MVSIFPYPMLHNRRRRAQMTYVTQQILVFYPLVFPTQCHIGLHENSLRDEP